ncbi:hypothetical protein CTAYLR_004844 [Chrysophaeum taylorii]|uniref:Uncharacterized protein n=1 Tax=Chrysophaeum taylorii TaxID=2483200 RepID=A0AAD7UGR6_9STRA|nr:hypothetical protein CTAYLR_004844 [Chrysophaeum taylorii]
MIEVRSSWSGLETTDMEETSSSGIVALREPAELVAETTQERCEIDARFRSDVRVSRVRIESNARNVELYVAKESGTFEYASTTRGRKQGDDERYEARIDRLDPSTVSVRLRALSLRGSTDRLLLRELVFEILPVHLAPLDVRSPPKEDLKVEHLATIGSQLLQAAEKRSV